MKVTNEKKLDKKEYDRLRYLENRDKIIIKTSKYQKEHPEKSRAIRKRYYYRNREEEIQRSILAGKKQHNKYPWLQSGRSARKRCNNKTNPDYRYYGARGIKYMLIDAELKYLWIKYKAYNLNKPSIDRIDNDGNYELNNCQFIELSENVAKSNRRKIIK